jgi:hypothetical protein
VYESPLKYNKIEIGEATLTKNDFYEVNDKDIKDEFDKLRFEVLIEGINKQKIQCWIYDKSTIKQYAQGVEVYNIVPYVTKDLLFHAGSKSLIEIFNEYENIEILFEGFYNNYRNNPLNVYEKKVVKNIIDAFSKEKQEFKKKQIQEKMNKIIEELR